MIHITRRSRRTNTPTDVVELIDEIGRIADQLQETASSASNCLQGAYVASQVEGPTHPMHGEHGKALELEEYLLDSIHFRGELLFMMMLLKNKAERLEESWSATGIRVSIDVAGEQRVSR